MFLHAKRFLEDESGPAAAEYAVLLGLILLAVIGAVTAVGNSTSGLWQNNTTRISNAMS